MQVTKVRIWRRIISFSGKRWRMYSAWEIKEHKWWCEGIKTFLFLGDISKIQNLPIHWCSPAYFQNQAAYQVSALSGDMEWAKGRILVQRFWFSPPKEVHPKQPSTQPLLTAKYHTPPDIPFFWYRLTLLCTGFIAMAKLFPALENTFYSTASSR